MITLAMVLVGLSFSPFTLAGGDLYVSQRFIDFDEVELNDNEFVEVTISNEGDAPITSLEIDLNADFEFRMDNDCPESLQPGESCEVEIEFSPDTVGRFDGMIDIDSDQEGTSITLTGMGVFED